MNFWLKNKIWEIRSISIDDNLSDAAIEALMNIHLSIMTMIVANMLEDEYGDVRYHREVMEQLFAAGLRRCRSNQSLLRRSKLIPVLYNIFSMPDAVFDSRKHDMCLRRTFGLAEAWRNKTKNSGCQNAKERMTEYGVLLSVADAFTFIIDEDKQTNNDFCCLKQRIEEWAAAMDVNGDWDGISNDEALRRLEIMIANSNTHSDSRFDGLISKSLNFYFERISKEEKPDGRTLFYLYWGMMWGVQAPDYAKVNRLAEKAFGQAMSTRQGSDDWFWHLATCIDRECAKINHEIKQQMLAYIA